MPAALATQENGQLWKGSKTGRKPAPADFEQCYREYYDYTVSLVGKYGIEQQSRDDVAQEILLRFYERDSLSYFDPEKEFHGVKGQTTTFRTFLTGFVRTYVQHHRERQGIRWEREVIIAHEDVVTEDGPESWWDLKLGSTELDLGPLELGIMAQNLREFLVRAQVEVDAAKLAAPGRKSKAGSLLDLPALFDAIVAEVRAHGDVRPKAVQATLGISDTTYYEHMRVLRAEVRTWMETTRA